MTQARKTLLGVIERGVDQMVSPTLADMVRDGVVTVDEVAAKFMLEFVRKVRERTDWPQQNKRG